MSESRLDPTPEDAGDLERQLASLKPRASGVGRDQLMFLAGQQAARPKPVSRAGWLWPLATAASWLITATVLGLWTIGPGTAPLPIATQTPVESSPSEHREIDTSQLAESDIPDDRPTAAGAPMTRRRTSRHGFGGETDADIDRFLTGGALWTHMGRGNWRRSAIPSAGTNDAPDRVTPRSSEPPATYARLMKQYRNQDANEPFLGDRL